MTLRTIVKRIISATTTAGLVCGGSIALASHVQVGIDTTSVQPNIAISESGSPQYSLLPASYVSQGRAHLDGIFSSPYVSAFMFTGTVAAAFYKTPFPPGDSAQIEDLITVFANAAVLDPTGAGITQHVVIDFYSRETSFDAGQLLQGLVAPVVFIPETQAYLASDCTNGSGCQFFGSDYFDITDELLGAPEPFRIGVKFALPEPSALALLGIGAAGFLMSKWRREAPKPM